MASDPIVRPPHSPPLGLDRIPACGVTCGAVSGAGVDDHQSGAEVFTDRTPDNSPPLDYATPGWAGSPLAYFEKRFDGTRKFDLVDGRLRIKGSNSLRSDFELSFELSRVSPAYSVLRVRHRLFFIALFILIGFVVVGVGKGDIIMVSVGVVLPLILMALSFRKQTFYQFHYLTGGVAFDVCEAGPQKKRAAEFVRAVVAVIRASATQSVERQGRTEVNVPGVE